MADVIATEGYKEAGYEYVIIDDCWMASSRAPNGQLVPEPTLYSNGIKPVIDYVRMCFFLKLFNILAVHAFY